MRLNLWHFLELTSRQLVDSLQYIDAFGINQLDLTDEGHQVQFMSPIYRDAYEVIVWLGRPDNDPALLAGLKDLQDHRDWSTNEIWTFESKAFEYLSTCQYWSRTWIVRVSLLGDNVRLLCGDFALHWIQLATLRPQPLQETFDGKK